MQFGLDWGRARPDKDSARVAWNQSWESDLQYYYSAVKSGHIKGIHVPQHVQNLSRGPMQVMKLGLLQQTKHINKLQQDIRDFALPKLAIDDLEENWKSLDATRREQLILLAFYKASISSPDMEHHRKWCPEMTIANISANDGKYFMDLLTELITQRSDAPDSEVINFQNPTFDYLLGSSRVRALGEIVRRHAESNRTYFISVVVWRILLAFFDLDEPSYVGKPPKVKETGILKRAKQLGNEELVRHIKREMKQFKSDISQTHSVNTCWNCSKGTSYLPNGTHLLVCPKCKEIGRIIRYCSKECQKQDWKNGHPKPHKEICGKPLEEGAPSVSKEEALGSSAHPEFSLMIPYPDPNFKRSPALQHQIRKIRQNKDSDYMIFQNGNLPDFGAKIEGPVQMMILRIHFLVFRRRAFQSGDKAAVHTMFDILRGFANQVGVPVSKLADQLEKEYGIPVIKDKAMRTAEMPSDATMEEKEWALQWLSQLGDIE